MGRDRVVFLCSESELTRERRGYFRALSKLVDVHCLPLDLGDAMDQVAELSGGDSQVLLAIEPEGSPRLPYGLTKSKVPTACFHIDTYSGTDWRLKWSMLYDYAFVFHPGYPARFQRAGHPRAVLVPHAVEAELFEPQTQNNRAFDVGWVGNLDGNIYKTRQRVIGRLRAKFAINDTERYYAPEEMASVYAQSRVVVNVSRDDYLEDANLRCFEAMAAGSLLITHKPTELSEIGFAEGAHYVTFSSEEQVGDLVSYYLDHEAERAGIAAAARDLVLREHTYDNRAARLLQTVLEDHGKLHSPARAWDSELLHETYLHFFAKHLMLKPALAEMKTLAKTSASSAVRMTPMMGKALVRSLQRSFNSPN